MRVGACAAVGLCLSGVRHAACQYLVDGL